jgi:hypothetical protein
MYARAQMGCGLSGRQTPALPEVRASETQKIARKQEKSRKISLEESIAYRVFHCFCQFSTESAIDTHYVLQYSKDVRQITVQEIRQ